jgi:hypothetical protein
MHNTFIPKTQRSQKKTRANYLPPDQQEVQEVVSIRYFFFADGATTAGLPLRIMLSSCALARGPWGFTVKKKP